MLTEKFWEKYFKMYDVINLFIPYQRLLDEICNQLEIQRGEKILEAGCGTCNLVLKIKERGAKVIGLDNVKMALSICKQKDPTIETVFADLREQLPFEDSYFDKVACNNTLYAIPREKQLGALKEFYRVLKTGGKLVLSNPKRGWKPLKIYITGLKDNLNEEGIIATFCKIIKMVVPTVKIFYYNLLIQKEGNYHFLDPKEQKELLEKAGFSKVSETVFYYGKEGILNWATK